MACRLLNSFRHLYINGRSMSTFCHQSVNSTCTLPSKDLGSLKLLNSISSSSNESNFTFLPRSIELGFTLPQSQILKISIIDAPISISRDIEEPQKIIHNKEDIIPDKFIDLPPLENIIEKYAVRMLRIRRHKMNVHKLKKLRRKMKYILRKLRARRKVRKEKRFRRQILAQVKVAEKFDAKEYVESRIALLTKEILPTRWRREILPEAMIRQFKEERRRRMEAKFNRKRLTLD